MGFSKSRTRSARIRHKSASEPNLAGELQFIKQLKYNPFLQSQFCSIFFPKENSTPRFPDNLKHLIHEYVSVDQLKFYRKRRLPNADHGKFIKKTLQQLHLSKLYTCYHLNSEFHGKNHICLYDESLPIIPFSSMKTEYMKKFGQAYSPRSHSVPNKFNLNTTTNELLEALRDDRHSDLDLHRSTR